MAAAYKSLLGEMVDTYAIVLIGAIAFLTAIGGVYTMALQALICLVTAAFCSLLWGRLINYLYMSATKDKYKYFHFERKEVEDDE
jgi:heme/copper-type cytochrome/quinol oxidase subunit 4